MYPQGIKSPADKKISSALLRLEGDTGGLAAGAGVRRTYVDLTRRAVMLTVVIGAVFDVTADPVDMLGLAASAITVIHSPHLLSSLFALSLCRA